MMFNYNAVKFDIKDIIGQVDKDEKGNMVRQRNKAGQLIDKQKRLINKQGYLIDDLGNVIDKDDKTILCSR